MFDPPKPKSPIFQGFFVTPASPAGSPGRPPTRPKPPPPGGRLARLESRAEELDHFPTMHLEGCGREWIGAQQDGDQGRVGEVGEDGAIAAQEELPRVVVAQPPGSHLTLEEADRLVEQG